MSRRRRWESKGKHHGRTIPCMVCTINSLQKWLILRKSCQWLGKAGLKDSAEVFKMDL